MAFAEIDIYGNLGGDPEMRYTPNGTAVTSFSVAVNHSKPDGNGGFEDLGTDWFRVAVFGNAAERHAENLAKGDKVLVRGRFKAREFDRNDGSKGTSLDIVASRVTKVGAKGESSGRDAAFAYEPAYAGGNNGGGGASRADDLDDLPF